MTQTAIATEVVSSPLANFGHSHPQAALEAATPVAVYCGGPMPCRRRLNPDKSGSKNWYAETCIPYGLGDEPRRVIDELSQIRMVDVVLPTRSGVEIRKRCITQPTEHQAILLHHLGLHLPSDGFGRLTTGLPVAESKMKRM